MNEFYSYFCGANTSVKLIKNDDPTPLDVDIAGINYSINYNPQPIYGYCSNYYDAVLKGRQLVQGTLLINVNKAIGSNFLVDILNENNNRDIYGSVELNFASFKDFNIEINFGRETDYGNADIIIANCFLISKGKTIQISADSLIEEFNFFSRDLFKSNKGDKRREEGKRKREAERQKQIEEARVKEEQSKKENDKGKTSFLQNLFKPNQIKIETNVPSNDILLAENDENKNPFSININKDISLFNNPNTVVAYKAPFYAKSNESKVMIPQKVLNARLFNYLLNAFERYGTKNINSNFDFLKDKKALELLIANNFKDISNSKTKTKQISNMLWTYLNQLQTPNQKIIELLPQNINFNTDYKKNESYIEKTNIKTIVDNFVNGNYSNNIGLSDKFFYENSNETPSEINTDHQDPLYENNLIFFLSNNIDSLPIIDQVSFDLKKQEYKKYYNSLWSKNPQFIKG